jgi:hypothetical protein
MLRKLVVRVEGGWNWLRVVTNGSRISDVEPADFCTIEFEFVQAYMKVILSPVQDLDVEGSNGQAG